MTASIMPVNAATTAQSTGAKVISFPSPRPVAHRAGRTEPADSVDTTNAPPATNVISFDSAMFKRRPGGAGSERSLDARDAAFEQETSKATSAPAFILCWVGILGFVYVGLPYAIMSLLL